MTLSCSNIANFSEISMVSMERPEVNNIMDALLNAPFEN